MPWSYTALTSFETCPRKHYHTRIAKDVPDPPGEAALWGTRVHEALEQRLVKGTPLPKGLDRYEPYVARIEQSPGDILVEQKVAIRRDHTPCDFFDADVWCRGVFDVAIVRADAVMVIDWKTGKRKRDNDQLQLFAAMASAIYPEAERIKTAFAWLKERKTDVDAYTKATLQPIWASFTRRANKLENAVMKNEFPPRPNGLCRRYCPVKSCEYHGE